MSTATTIQGRGRRRQGDGTRADLSVLDAGASRGQFRPPGISARTSAAATGSSNMNVGSSLDRTQAPLGALPLKRRRAPQRSDGMLRDVRQRRFLDSNPTQNTMDQRTALALGGTTTSQLSRISQWQPTGAGGVPKMGRDVNFQQTLAGEQGFPMFAGFGANIDPYNRGIIPTNKMAGTGGVGWAGFGDRTRVLDATPGVQPGALNAPGAGFADAQAGQSPFRTQVDWSGGARGVDMPTFDLDSNYTVPYHILLQPAAYKFNHNLQRHQMQFLWIPGTKGGLGKKNPLNGTSVVSQRRHIAFNMQTFNYLQAKEQKMPVDKCHPLLADDVWANWSYEGVVTGGETGDDDTGVSHATRAMANDFRPVERVINTVIKGAVNTINVWGKVATGTALWLILKQVPRNQIKYSPGAADGSFLLDPNGTAVVASGNRAGISTKPFQLIPWADPKHQGLPPPDVLGYADEFGVRRWGKAIFVGTVEDYTSKDASQSLTDIAPFNAKVVAGELQQIRIHVSLGARSL